MRSRLSIAEADEAVGQIAGRLKSLGIEVSSYIYRKAA